MDNTYARTLRRRGPGRPRTRTEGFRPHPPSTIGQLMDQQIYFEENERVDSAVPGLPSTNMRDAVVSFLKTGSYGQELRHILQINEKKRSVG